MDLSQLRFDVLRNALYHAARRRWFEVLARLLNFTVVIAGAATLSEIVPTQWIPLQKTLASLTTLTAGTIQLVYDFAVQGIKHEHLQRRYYELLSEIDRFAAPSEEDMRKWQSKMVSIYGDEPPTMRALDATAYNDAVDSLGYGNRLKISRSQSVFRHILSYQHASFQFTEEKDDMGKLASKTNIAAK